MSDSLRTKAAAALRNAHSDQAAGSATRSSGNAVTTSDLTFRVKPEDARRLEQAHAVTRRQLDRSEQE
ncbi:MAG: hypothetical protein WDN49_25690 [Acetobacteraceae bacterium]